MSGTRWELFMIETQDGPAGVAVDLALESEAPIARLPELHLVLTAPPREDQAAALAEHQAHEDRLMALFASRGAVHVGSLTSKGTRSLFWYAPSGSDLAGVPASFPPSGAPWSHRHQPDPEWALFRQVLLPRDADRRRMQILKALAALAERGDPLETARLVEYRALFAERANLASFERQATDAGFRAVVAPERASDMWRSRVGIRHPLSFEELTSRVERLALLAEANQGRYEGFDTHAVRDEPPKR
jgi:hypothetical protein